MSFKFSAAHSSRIKKSTKPPSGRNSPFSSLPRRKAGPRATSTKKAAAQGHDDDGDDEDFFQDELDDLGLVKALATDLTLRDVAQAIMYIRGQMWSSMPNERTGMNSTRIAEVLNFRAALPPIVTVSHVQALLNSPTAVEREMAELIRGGAVRKVVVGGRGSIGEVLILVRDLEEMIAKSAALGGDDEEGDDDEEVAKKKKTRESFTTLLRERPTAMKINRNELAADEAKALIHAGFLTSTTTPWTTTEVFSAPGEGSRGTMTSLNSISRAASGSLAAVGGEGAVHAAGGSGGPRGIGSAGSHGNSTGEFSLAIPSTGAYLKLVAEARAHLRSLLTRSSRVREAPESVLRERWDGGLAADGSGDARRARGEFAGVLPGRTRKWKQFYGLSFEFVLGECVGAGLVEVFDTGSVGRGVRAL
jgi:hypothetical protein